MRLDDQLGDRLRRAHHAGRIHRLVGGDQDEALDAVLASACGEDPGADDVVLDRLARVRLHQRHVLVRGGVEDEVRRYCANTLRTRAASVTSPITVCTGLARHDRVRSLAMA